jgi:hypothetical protein
MIIPSQTVTDLGIRGGQVIYTYTECKYYL